MGNRWETNRKQTGNARKTQVFAREPVENARETCFNAAFLASTAADDAAAVEAGKAALRQEKIPEA